MDKDIFLANLQKFLKSVVCEDIYANVSTEAKHQLEKDIEEFIRKNASEYSIQELRETFTSAQVSIGLFIEYRDAKIFVDQTQKGSGSSCGIMTDPLTATQINKESVASQLKEWREPITGMLFVRVPGGCFQMGCGEWDDEGLADATPPHEVCLDGFWDGKFAVTVPQYMKFAKATGSHFPHWLEKDSPCNITTGNDDCYKKMGKALIGEIYPIIGVSWNDAMAFAEWLSEKTVHTFSLPTEAEWEYAARSGGKPEKYPGGYTVDQVAWYFENSDGLPHAVGTKTPNGLGIHNMSGNVSEWCLDLYSRFAYSKHERNNPVNLNDGSCRVVRGGSWNYGARDVRCTDRSIFVPEVRTNDIGFRLVKKPL